MRNFFEYVANEFYIRGIINGEDRNALRFGIELIVTQVITFFSLVVISVLTRNLLECFIYCFFFIWGRKVFEGYHAKTFMNCYILTIISFLAVLFLHNVNLPYFLLNVLTCIMIMIYTVNHKNSKIKIIEYIFVFILSMVTFYYFHFSNLVNIMTLTLFMVLCVSHRGEGLI